MLPVPSQPSEPERGTRNPRPSAFVGDNVCLDIAVHIHSPEPPGDRFRRDVGGFAEPRRIARLDFVPPVAVQARSGGGGQLHHPSWGCRPSPRPHRLSATPERQKALYTSSGVARLSSGREEDNLATTTITGGETLFIGDTPPVLARGG